MATKLPKLFRAPITSKKYKKRIEKRVFLENDRRFLNEITTSNADGQVILARELTEKETKRLATLLKKTKKNKGTVRRGKLVVLLVIAAAVVGFGLLFRNPIAERVTEQLLERVFAAESQVSGMEFRPLAGIVQFDSLVVADRDQPMQNLFELSSGRLDLDLWQAFQGNVVINDLTVSGLAFATVREQSGALAPRQEQPDSAPEDGGFSLESLGLPDTLDAQAFVQQNIELLETPDLAETFIQQSESFLTDSREQTVQIEEQTTETFSRVSEFAETDFSAVDNLQQAVRLYEQSTDLLADATATARTVERQVQELQTETDALLAQAARLSGSAAQDFDRLVALIPDIEVDGPEFLRGLVEPVIRNALGGWYGRINKGYEYFQRVQSLRNAGEPRGMSRRSTVVNYDTTRYPVFLLEEGFFSSTGDTQIEATVQQVSSDQAINNSPTIIDYRMTSDSSETNVGAILDFREDADLTLALSFTTAGVPIDVTEAVDAIGFERFSGTATVDVEYSVGPQATAGTARIDISEPGFTTSGEVSQIGGFVDEIVRDAGSVNILVSFTIDQDGTVSLAGTDTNLDEAFGGAIQEQIDATITEFRNEMESVLQTALAGDLESVANRLDSLTGMNGEANALLRQAQESQQLAQSVVNRAEQEVESLRQQVEQQAQDAVEQAAGEAREQAEDAVDEQVDRIRDRLPLPGF